MSQRMMGKTVLITGASSGLGLASMKALATQGARIIAVVRDVEKLKAVLPPGVDDIHIESCDLANQDSVRRCAERLIERQSPIDVLLNNAGVANFTPSQTRDGFESNFGTNHLGHFQLTALLFPLLAAAPAGRIVTVSSIVHRRGHLDLKQADFARHGGSRRAYANSKLANLVFSLELARRLKRAHPQMASVAAHPGWTDTPLFRHANAAALLSRLFAMDVDAGAAPQIAAASDPGIPNGAYWGPTGWREIWGPPGRAVPAPHAQDEALAQELWARSEDWTRTPFAL